MKLAVDNGYIEYSIEEDEVIIDNIKVYEQRKGTGRLLIDKIKDIASALSLPVTLYAYPQDNTITQEELRQFYYSCGFELHPDDVDYNYFIFE